MTLYRLSDDPPTLVDPERFDPVGRIAFAGSDLARKHAGWFEGALISGAAAAAHVRRLGPL